MLIIAIGLISGEMLESLRTRFGGFTPEAAGELFSVMMRDTSSPGVLKRWPKGNDGRYAARARQALQLLAKQHTQMTSSAAAEACTGAVLFFSPLVPEYGPGQETDLNDSGGVGGGGPVLSPQRCRDLLDCFRAVNLPDLESSINGAPDIFDGVDPFRKLQKGRDLIDYLQSYATILEEAVANKMFYTSFFT